MKINNFSKITSNILGSRLTGFIRDVLLANFDLNLFRKENRFLVCKLILWHLVVVVTLFR